MKPLVSAAVFGLVPVPPVPDTHACNRNCDDRPTTAEELNPSRLVCLPPNSTERMATEDELARIRHELGNPTGTDNGTAASSSRN